MTNDSFVPFTARITHVFSKSIELVPVDLSKPIGSEGRDQIAIQLPMSTMLIARIRIPLNQPPHFMSLCWPAELDSEDLADIYGAELVVFVKKWKFDDMISRDVRIPLISTAPQRYEVKS